MPIPPAAHYISCPLQPHLLYSYQRNFAKYHDMLNCPQYVFDLELPESFTPANNDGEVSSWLLLPVKVSSHWRTRGHVTNQVTSDWPGHPRPDLRARVQAHLGLGGAGLVDKTRRGHGRVRAEPRPDRGAHTSPPAHDVLIYLPLHMMYSHTDNN